MAARFAVRGIGIAVVALCAAIVLTTRPADPKLWPAAKNAETIDILLVSNGFHSGVVLPRETLLRVADGRNETAVRDVALRFGAYPFIEFGWGEEEFYRNTPTVSSIDPVLALRALFWPFTKSVVHVVGIDGDPAIFFESSDRIPVSVSEKGFERLVAKLDASFRQGADGGLRAAGQGLYGPSLFYPATGHFSIVADCNWWAGELLAAAGLPSSRLLSLVSPIFVPSLRYAMRRAEGQ